MGLELSNCKAQIKDKTTTGKLYLDSQELRFRSDDIKWVIKIGQGTSAKVTNGNLTVRRGAKTATFSVGEKAEKWADKILNPPTRATKLGVIAESGFLLKGRFPKSFKDELLAHGMVAKRTANRCAVIFILTSSNKDLKSFDQLASSSNTGTHLWIVWPKGDPSFGQSEVIGRGKKLGMGPGKKISFDETHTAMRFTKK